MSSFAHVAQAPRVSVKAARGCQPCCANATNAVAASKLPDLQPMDGRIQNAEGVGGEVATLNVCQLNWYPFIEPSRCKERSQGEEQLQAIIGAGCTTFVSLQSEVAAQERMPMSGTDGFYPYKSTADLIAACLSDVPPSEVVEGLRNPYLDKFVPPRRRAASAAYQNYKPIRPVYVHYPFVDLSVPSMELLDTVVDDVAARLSSDEALHRVQAAFETRNDTTSRSPQTDEQIQMVRDFAAR